jgi:hypothetical protein
MKRERIVVENVYVFGSSLFSVQIQETGYLRVMSMRGCFEKLTYWQPNEYMVHGKLS